MEARAEREMAARHVEAAEAQDSAACAATRHSGVETGEEQVGREEAMKAWVDAVRSQESADAPVQARRKAGIQGEEGTMHGFGWHMAARTAGSWHRGKSGRTCWIREEAMRTA